MAISGRAPMPPSPGAQKPIMQPTGEMSIHLFGMRGVLVCGSKVHPLPDCPSRNPHARGVSAPPAVRIRQLIGKE
jgi:hypothetical protein